MVIGIISGGKFNAHAEPVLKSLDIKWHAWPHCFKNSPANMSTILYCITCNVVTQGFDHVHQTTQTCNNEEPNLFFAEIQPRVKLVKTNIYEAPILLSETALQHSLFNDYQLISNEFTSQTIITNCPLLIAMHAIRRLGAWISN